MAWFFKKAMESVMPDLMSDLSPGTGDKFEGTS